MRALARHDLVHALDLGQPERRLEVGQAEVEAELGVQEASARLEAQIAQAAGAFGQTRRRRPAACRLRRS